MMNAVWVPLNFELPEADAATISWHCWIDTSKPSLADLAHWATAPAVVTDHQPPTGRSPLPGGGVCPDSSRLSASGQPLPWQK